MDPLLQSAERAEHLAGLDDPRSKYVFSRIFESSGWGAKRRNKFRLKLLQNLDAELQRMLHDGERVLAVTPAQEYSLLESYFMGLWAYALNRRALVFTNQRMLVLQVDWRCRLSQLKSQIRYGAIAKLGGKLTGQLKVALARGKTLAFTQIPRASRQPLRALIEERRAAAQPVSFGGLEYLCPHCYEALAELVPDCPKCRSVFKSASKARALSFVFPGLGDLYLGHRALGCFEILGAFALWSIFALAIAQAESVADAAIVFAFGLGFNALDAWVTGHTASKGLYAE
jgi:hypothetical protein